MKILIRFYPYLTCFKEDGFRVIIREFDSEENFSRFPNTNLFRGSVEEERQGYSFNTEDAFNNNIDQFRRGLCGDRRGAWNQNAFGSYLRWWKGTGAPTHHE